MCKIIQGTIAAAAVINEVIAVIVAKKLLNGQENSITNMILNFAKVIKINYYTKKEQMNLESTNTVLSSSLS